MDRRGPHREHLLHLELRTRAAGDDRLGLLPARFALLAQVVLFGIPGAHCLEPQRDESESVGIDSGSISPDRYGWPA